MAVTVIAISWLGWKQYAVMGTQEGDVSRPAQTREGSAPAPSESPGQSAAHSAVRSNSRTPVETLPGGEEPDLSGAKPEGQSSPLERIAAFDGAEEGEAGSEEFPQDGDEAYWDDLAAEDEQPLEPDDYEQREVEAREGVASLQPGVDEPRSYWQLPQAWRSEMPEFKISVLVYAETPEDRFILINGERLREGEELEDGLLLEEIRRDGAVFSYNRTKFLVKS